MRNIYTKPVSPHVCKKCGTLLVYFDKPIPPNVKISHISFVPAEEFDPHYKSKKMAESNPAITLKSKN